MKLPSPAEIEALHHRYAPNQDAFEAVYIHCQIVWDIARQLMIDSSSRFSVDEELVKVGALLHDIGVYRLYNSQGKVDQANYIRHGILGEDVLKEAGFDEVMCRFASRHTGVGLSKNDIVLQKLPLPPQDFLAETDEELLVMYADKFHSKTDPPCFNTANYYKQHVRRFGEDKVTKFEEMIQKFGVPDIDRLAKKYGHNIRA